MPEMTFVGRDGVARVVPAPVGDSLLDISRDNDIDIEGACDGNMACATCHVIVDEAWAGRLPAPSEEEEDMLDLAFNLTPTSRLGCQIRITEALDGLVVTLPPDGGNTW